MQLSCMRAAFFLFLGAVSTSFSEEWNIVHLASFPRSGNHWVRYLVEEATHITTSSAYRDRDFPHIRERFPWGGFATDHGYRGNCRFPTGDDPVLLKTHYPFLQGRALEAGAKATICLIRHPVDAFYSYHIYRQHGVKDLEISDEIITDFIKHWRAFYEFWENQPDVLIVRYEDLYENTAFELTRILEKAGYTFDSSDVERAINAYPPRGNLLKHAHRYNPHKIEIIRARLQDLLSKYGYTL